MQVSKEFLSLQREVEKYNSYLKEAERAGCHIEIGTVLTDKKLFWKMYVCFDGELAGSDPIYSRACEEFDEACRNLEFRLDSYVSDYDERYIDHLAEIHNNNWEKTNG